MATTRNIQMQYFNGSDYDILYPQVNLSNVSGSISINNISGNLPATRVSYSNSSTSSIITGSNVQLAIDQLFQSVSNGKSQIASAITDKGVSTSSSASFSTMASNIRRISTGLGGYSEGVQDNVRQFGAVALTSGGYPQGISTGWNNLTSYRNNDYSSLSQLCFLTFSLESDYSRVLNFSVIFTSQYQTYSYSSSYGTIQVGLTVVSGDLTPRIYNPSSTLDACAVYGAYVVMN